MQETVLNRINIAMGFDKNFAIWAGITIKSILLKNNNVKFYLMYTGVRSGMLKKIKKLIESHNAEVEFVDMGKRFSNFFVGCWSMAMYFPLALPSVCPNEDRVLFLDADTLVTGNLDEFYHQDLEGYYLAAVHDYGMIAWMKMGQQIKIDDETTITAKEYFDSYRKWNSEEMKSYFNSGMLLMNLKEMRKDNIEEKMLESIRTEKFAFPDQDCINYACHNKVKIVSPYYNYMVVNEPLWGVMDDQTVASLANFRYEKEAPLIIHFLTKPWIPTSDKVSFKDLFLDVKRQTPWKNYRSKQEIKKLIQFRFGRKKRYFKIFNWTVFDYEV